MRLLNAQSVLGQMLASWTKRLAKEALQALGLSWEIYYVYCFDCASGAMPALPDANGVTMAAADAG